jgi:hypothetical protein
MTQKAVIWSSHAKLPPCLLIGEVLESYEIRHRKG